METLEYNVLRERAYNSPGTLLQPSMEEMQQWVTGLNRRRSLHLAATEDTDPCEASFRELEQRYHVQDVWGHTTTPAMQTLECIQKVKQALVEGVDDDTISSGTFSLLVALSVAAAVAIVLVWELYLRPRNHGLPA